MVATVVVGIVVDADVVEIGFIDSKSATMGSGGIVKVTVQADESVVKGVIGLHFPLPSSL